MLAAQAGSKNPADYPQRIHIFKRSETTFYHHRAEEEAKGEGRADLFENGEPKGIDFQFDCSDKLQTSAGDETFPAKWKKPNEELVILQPKFGKADSYTTCNLKVVAKDQIYYMAHGDLAMEAASMYKQWMLKHEYDPEHGKNVPVFAPPSPTTPAASGEATGETATASAIELFWHPIEQENSPWCLNPLCC